MDFGPMVGCSIMATVIHPFLEIFLVISPFVLFPVPLPQLVVSDLPWNSTHRILTGGSLQGVAMLSVIGFAVTVDPFRGCITYFDMSFTPVNVS